MKKIFMIILSKDAPLDTIYTSNRKPPIKGMFFQSGQAYSPVFTEAGKAYDSLKRAENMCNQINKSCRDIFCHVVEVEIRVIG